MHFTFVAQSVMLVAAASSLALYLARRRSRNSKPVN